MAYLECATRCSDRIIPPDNISVAGVEMALVTFSQQTVATLTYVPHFVLLCVHHQQPTLLWDLTSIRGFVDRM